MGLRDEALAAVAAAVEQRKTAARTVLAARLTPAEVSELTVEATTDQLVVFTDGTIYLAVRDQTAAQGVYLVESDGTGGWTALHAVDDLCTLGALLDGETPA